MTDKDISNPLACLGPEHETSYTAEWCVAVWPWGHNVWICDTENQDGSVVVVTRDINDSDSEIVDIWEGHVSNLPPPETFQKTTR